LIGNCRSIAPPYVISSRDVRSRTFALRLTH
jgi:hypothetical protein